MPAFPYQMISRRSLSRNRPMWDSLISNLLPYLDIREDRSITFYLLHGAKTGLGLGLIGDAIVFYPLVAVYIFVALTLVAIRGVFHGALYLIICLGVIAGLFFNWTPNSLIIKPLVVVSTLNLEILLKPSLNPTGKAVQF